MSGLPDWMASYRAVDVPPLPVELKRKPLPEWTRAERETYEPDGMVWSVDSQSWVCG